MQIAGLNQWAEESVNCRVNQLSALTTLKILNPYSSRRFGGKALKSRRVNPRITAAAMGHDILKLCKTHSQWRTFPDGEGLWPLQRLSTRHFGAVHCGSVPGSHQKAEAGCNMPESETAANNSQSRGSWSCLRDVVWLLPEGICPTSNFKFIKQQSLENVPHVSIVSRLHGKYPFPLPSWIKRAFAGVLVRAQLLLCSG